jgi:hypothetical protein
MREWVIPILLGACGTRQPVVNTVGSTPPDAASLRAPVTCGAGTCGPDEYCENKCTCCGMRIADPSQARGTQTCKPLPAVCHGANPPECQQRTVDVPCA